MHQMVIGCVVFVFVGWDALRRAVLLKIFAKVKFVCGQFSSQ